MPPLAKIVTVLVFIYYQNEVRATVKRSSIEMHNHIPAAGVGDIAAMEGPSSGASQVDPAHFYNGGFNGTTAQSTTDSFGEACSTYDILSRGVNTIVLQKQVTTQPFGRYFHRYLGLSCFSKRVGSINRFIKSATLFQNV
jgi:hypothetical protein